MCNLLLVAVLFFIMTGWVFGSSTRQHVVVPMSAIDCHASFSSVFGVISGSMMACFGSFGACL